jgi:hypothetical protein
MRLLAIIINATESWLFAGVKTEVDNFEKGISTMRSVFYFLVRATRYNKRGSTTITHAVEIKIDPAKHTRADAELFAARTFDDLDDRWTICVSPVSHDDFIWTKRSVEKDLKLIERIATSEPTTKTNS